MQHDRDLESAGPPSEEWIRLTKYLTDELGAEERLAVERWIAANARRAATVSALRTAWLETLDPQHGIDSAAALATVLRRAGIQSMKDATKVYGTPPRSPRLRAPVFARHEPVLPRVMRYTVASLMVGVLVILVRWTMRGDHTSQHALGRVSTYVTANGERATITLPDGNTVALDVASRLEVPADYALGDHTVRLTGEGLFMIQHHDAVPFTVVAGSATARVLGTSFLVRHYAADSTTLVAVRDGRVSVYSLVLTAARMVELGRTGVARVRMADSSQFSFVTGTLVLNGVLFPEAIREMDRWYNVDIRLGDSTLATRRIAGECIAGSVSELANILHLQFGVRVVRDGRVLTLFPR